MSTILLTTKLHIPTQRPGLEPKVSWGVPRSHLVERLNDGLRQGCKLALLSAPAGYGKTMLLSTWISNSKFEISDFEFCWFSIDEGDNDPARFLAYLIAAIQTVDESIGQDLHFSQLGSKDSLTVLINQISTLPHKIILILDDCHLVTAQPVHDILAFLLDHLPDNFRLVIATRADVPLPVARLRARGQLVELRQADLRFTHAEAAQFLHHVMGLPLSEDDITMLASRTEGWIAGLQMAALAMQGKEDYQAFVAAFAGSNRYILDYFLEEVLRRESVSVQTFLLQTSILDRLCGPLCDAVFGMESGEWSLDSRPLATDHYPLATVNSRDVLQYLERANLFIVPLDERREWYRYHQLFADLLRSRLQQTQPDSLPALHRRASAWHEQNGLLEEAIEHALSAGDSIRAAELIERAAEPTFMRSEMATFLHWVEQLPQELHRPTLSVYHAWALLWKGAPLEMIESRLDAAKDASGGAIALRAFVALCKGQIEQAAGLARQAMEQIPAQETFLHSLAITLQATSLMVEGDVTAALHIMEEAILVGQKSGNVMVVALTLCNLAELHHKRGQLRQADALYRRALECAIGAQGRRLPIASAALMGLGALAREWDDVETSERLLTEGIELARGWNQLLVMEGYLSLVRIYQVRGDLDKVHQAIRLAREIARQFDLTEIDDYVVDLYEAQVHIGQGDLALAQRWAEQRGLEGNAPAVLERTEVYPVARLRKYEYSVLARLWLAEGRYDDAIELLEHLASLTEQMGRNVLLIEADLLKALVYYAQGQTAQAAGALEHALRRAEPEGFVRIFLDEGENVQALLKMIRSKLEDAKLVTYVDKLLAAFSNLQLPTFNFQIEKQSRVQNLIEPLSERELEVLRLLPSSLSSAEMADELAISVNTLRTHLKSIYGKLGAHSRYEALARANELNLL